MNQLEYQYPTLSLLFILPMAIVFYYYARRVFQKLPRLQFSAISNFSQQKHHSTTRYSIKSQLLLWLQTGGLCCLIMAALNPIKIQDIESVKQYGIDMVIALDVSNSMTEGDFQPGDRFTAAKLFTYDFVSKRKNDRIGLLLFAADAFVQSPQTTDIKALLQIIEQIEMGWIQGNSTSIGSALAVSASRLVKSESKNKIIILISDGQDTAIDKIRPIAAANAVKEVGIKVYTLGLGREKFTDLQKISKITGGKFFVALNSQQFLNNMREIDRLEKSLVKKNRYQVVTEYSSYFIWAALFLLMAYVFLNLFLLPEKLA